MVRTTLAVIAGLFLLSAGMQTQAGHTRGYGHGYYSGYYPGAATTSYYGGGYWYNTPFYSNGTLFNYYGGYRPSYSYGLYNDTVATPGLSVPYDYAPYQTTMPTSINQSMTSFYGPLGPSPGAVPVGAPCNCKK